MPLSARHEPVGLILSKQFKLFQKLPGEIGHPSRIIIGSMGQGHVMDPCTGQDQELIPALHFPQKFGDQMDPVKVSGPVCHSPEALLPKESERLFAYLLDQLRLPVIHPLRTNRVGARDRPRCKDKGVFILDRFGHYVKNETLIPTVAFLWMSPFSPE